MIKICGYCKEEFETTQKKRICCSRECSNKLRYPKKEVDCNNCGSKIVVPVNSTQTLCDNKCRHEWTSKTNKGENNPNYKGGTDIINCSNCQKEIEVRKYNLYNSNGVRKKNICCSIECKAELQKTTLLGKSNPNFSALEVECEHCKKKIFRTKTRLKYAEKQFCDGECKAQWQSIHMRGPNNHSYIHGLSDEYRLERRFHPLNREWRESVFKRDNYECLICSQSYDLQAHHINSYDWYEEGRVDVDNGVTLCRNHHTEFHKKYGFGKNTKEQFDEFIKLY